MLHSQNPNSVDLFLVSETNTLKDIFICAVKFNLSRARKYEGAAGESRNKYCTLSWLTSSLSLPRRHCSSTSVSHLGLKEWSAAEPRRSRRHIEPRAVQVTTTQKPLSGVMWCYEALGSCSCLWETGIYRDYILNGLLNSICWTWFKRMELRKIVPNLLVLYVAFGHFSESSEFKGRPFILNLQ